MSKRQQNRQNRKRNAGPVKLSVGETFYRVFVFLSFNVFKEFGLKAHVSTWAFSWLYTWMTVIQPFLSYRNENKVSSAQKLAWFAALIDILFSGMLHQNKNPERATRNAERDFAKVAETNRDPVYYISFLRFKKE
jgi:hypothetical protein